MFLGSTVSPQSYPSVTRAPFAPGSILSAGEIGAWYDISDVSSLRQGRTGPTALRADVGQPVGLVIDKSKMGGRTVDDWLAYTPELCTNGTFATTSGWTVTVGTGTLSVSGGRLRVTSIATDNTRVSMPIQTVVGNCYQVAVRLYQTSNTFSINVSNSSNLSSSYASSNHAVGAERNVVVFFVAQQTTTYIGFEFISTVAGNYAEASDVSVKHLPGNHLIAAADAARPILRSKAVESRLAGRTEMVSNGNFSGGNFTGWTTTVAGSLSVVDGKLRVSVVTPTGNWQAVWADQSVSGFTPGKKYRLKVTYTPFGLHNGTNIGPQILGRTSQVFSTRVTQTVAVEFLATSATHTVRLRFDTNVAAGPAYVDWDDISVKEVNQEDLYYYLGFDGSDDAMESLFVSPTDSMTMNRTAVIQTQVYPVTLFRGLLGAGNSGSNPDLAGPEIAINSTGQLRIHNRSTVARDSSGVGPVVTSLDRPVMLANRSTSTRLDAWVDDTQVYTSGEHAAATAVNIGGKLHIGRRMNNTEHILFDFYGAIVIGRTLGDAEMVRLSTNYAKKAGL